MTRQDKASGLQRWKLVIHLDSSEEGSGVLELSFSTMVTFIMVLVQPRYRFAAKIGIAAKKFLPKKINTTCDNIGHACASSAS